MFTEPKREFYEKTSVDYYSFKRTIGRIIRLPIKIIDILNCKHANIIVTNSYYSSYKLKKIYNKKSFVVQPGLNDTRKTITIKNNKKIFIVGLISSIKGYIFSINQLKSERQLNALGRKNEDTNKILELSKKRKVKINLIETENNKIKCNFYNKFSIFLANQIREPFGLTTLEAIDSNKIVLGINWGGTCEIIRNNVNGYLYPNNLNVARLVLNKVLNQDIIKLQKIVNFDEGTIYSKISYIYHHLKHEPKE